VDRDTAISRQLRTARRLNTAQQMLKAKFAALTRGKVGKKWVAPSERDVQDMAQWVQQQKTYWPDKLQNDPGFREQILLFTKDQQALQANQLRGELSVEERLEKGRKMSHRGLKAFQLADDKGWTPDSEWATTIGGATYAASSVAACKVLFIAPIMRIALLLGTQIAAAYSDPHESHDHLQKTQWVINGTYVVAAFYFTAYASVLNGWRQSNNVARMTLEQPYYSWDISSNKCSIIGPDGQPMDLKLRSLRSAQNDHDTVRDCVIAYNKGTYSALRTQRRRLKLQLREHAESIRKLSKDFQTELRKQRRAGIPLTPEEAQILDGNMRHDERLQAVLLLKDTPNAPDATKTKAISKALSLAKFHRDLFELLSASADELLLSEVSVDDSDHRLLPTARSLIELSVVSEDSADGEALPEAQPDGPVPISERVPDVLRDLYVFLQQEVSTLTAMRRINIQANLGHSRVGRVFGQEVATVLSWIPNLIATLAATPQSMTATAFTIASTASALGFGFGMDVGLMAVLVLIPFIYSRTHPYLAKPDLEHKLIAQGVAFGFTSGANFLGKDGKIDPKRVAASVKSIVDAVFAHVSAILDADARIYTQDLLAYATDPSTVDERLAIKAQVSVAGKTVTVPCTYRALSAAFRQCKTDKDRLRFVESLADSRQVSPAVRESMVFVLSFYEVNARNIEHAKNGNVIELIGPASTLPVESRQIIFQSLRFAELRFRAYDRKNEVIRDTEMYKELHEWSRILSDLKGRVENNALLGDLQHIQKGGGYAMGLLLLGTAAPVLIKAIVVAVVLVLDNLGVALHISTKVKLVGNSLTLLTLFVSAFAAYATFVLIGNKNGWRNFISADGNVFHTDMLSEYPGLFSLARMFSLVVQHQPLMATPVEERDELGVSAHLFGRFMNFLSHCYAGAEAAEKAAREAREARLDDEDADDEDDEDTTAVPPSTVVDLSSVAQDAVADSARESSSESPATDKASARSDSYSDSIASSTEEEHEDAATVEPIPPMPFSMPFSDASLLWSSMNAPTVKEIFTSFLEKYEKLDMKQLDKVASEQLKALEAMFLPPQQDTDSSSSRSSDDSSDDGDAPQRGIPAKGVQHPIGRQRMGLRDAMDAVVDAGLWSEEPLSPQAQRRQARALAKKIHQAGTAEKQHGAWAEVHEVLSQGLRTDVRLGSPERAGLRRGVRNAIGTLDALLPLLAKPTEKKRKLPSATSATSATSGTSAASAASTSTTTVPPLHASTTQSASQRIDQELQTVDQQMQALGLWPESPGRLKSSALHEHIALFVDQVILDGDPESVIDQCRQIRATLGELMLSSALSNKQKGLVAMRLEAIDRTLRGLQGESKRSKTRHGPKPSQVVRIPRELSQAKPAASLEPLIQTLDHNGLWPSRLGLSSKQLRAQGREWATRRAARPDSDTREVIQWLAQQQDALTQGLDQAQDKQQGQAMRMALTIVKAAVKHLNQGPKPPTVAQAKASLVSANLWTDAPFNPENDPILDTFLKAQEYVRPDELPGLIGNLKLLQQVLKTAMQSEKDLHEWQRLDAAVQRLRAARRTLGGRLARLQAVQHQPGSDRAQQPRSSNKPASPGASSGAASPGTRTTTRPKTERVPKAHTESEAVSGAITAVDPTDAPQQGVVAELQRLGLWFGARPKRGEAAELANHFVKGQIPPTQSEQALQTLNALAALRQQIVALNDRLLSLTTSSTSMGSQILWTSSLLDLVVECIDAKTAQLRTEFF